MWKFRTRCEKIKRTFEEKINRSIADNRRTWASKITILADSLITSELNVKDKTIGFLKRIKIQVDFERVPI